MAEVKVESRTAELREAVEALPRLRLTGEQLEGIDPDPEKRFFVDWDEYDEYVRLDDVRPILAALDRADVPAAPEEERPERFDRSWWHYADDCPVPPAAQPLDRADVVDERLILPDAAVLAALEEWNQRATGADGWPAMAELERLYWSASKATGDRQ